VNTNRPRGVRRRALGIVAIGALMGYALSSSCDRGEIVLPKSSQTPQAQSAGE